MLLHFIIALMSAAFLTAGLTFTATGVAQTQNQTTPAATAPVPAKNDYSKSESWLCRPGRQDACAVDLTTTIVAANGKLTRETWAANPKAPIDCFYVYPTVSTDATPNSDMVAGPEELNVIRAQFARFAGQVAQIGRAEADFSPLFLQCGRKPPQPFFRRPEGKDHRLFGRPKRQLTTFRPPPRISRLHARWPPSVSRTAADFAGEKGLRQRRAQIGKIVLLADEDGAALEAVLPEKRRRLAARLTAADNGNRRSGPWRSLFHHH